MPCIANEHRSQAAASSTRPITDAEDLGIANELCRRHILHAVVSWGSGSVSGSGFALEVSLVAVRKVLDRKSVV